MFRIMISKNKTWVLFAGVCTIFSSLTMVYAGYSLSFLFNAVNYTNNAINKLLNDAVKVTLIWLAALIMLYVKIIVRAHVIKRLRNDLRSSIALRIVDLDYEEFYKKDTGNYVSWLTSDVQQISEQAFFGFFNIIENVGTSIFSLLAMVKLNMYIGLTAVVLFVLLTLLPQLLSKLMVSVSKEQSVGQEKFVETVKETIAGYNVFRLYNLFP